MPHTVLDESAILAALRGEPGAAKVEACLPGARTSAVNYSEALAKLILWGVEPEDAHRQVAWLGIGVLPFDLEIAQQAADLIALTRGRGLSFGDRACLALAQKLRLPAATADRRWAGLELGIEIVLIR